MEEELEQGFLALPKSGGGAGVLVLHAWWGLTPFFRDLCTRLAGEGYMAFVPDLYGGKTAATIQQAEQLSSKMNRKQARAEISAAATMLLQLEATQGELIGVVGFSLGAYLGLGLAMERPELVGAIIVFYGARSGDYLGSKAAFLGHFAEEDAYVSASGVQKMQRDLRRADRPMIFHIYPGTRHWFFESDRPEYNEQASRLAWERSVEFLQVRL